MTIRDFFRLISKLFGLLLFVYILQSIIPVIGYMNFPMFMENGDFLSLFGLNLIPVIIAGIMIFKPDLLINLFRLDKGFEEKNVNLGTMTTASILMAAIVIVGFYQIASGVDLMIRVTINDLADQTLMNPREKRTILQSLFVNYGFYQLLVGIVIWVFRGQIHSLLLGSTEKASDEA